MHALYVLYASNTLDQLLRVQSVMFACKREIDNLFNIMLFDLNMFANKKRTRLNEY